MTEYHQPETTVRLHADGLNDDTPYMQARIDGRIIGRSDGAADDGSPGDYRATIDNLIIMGCKLEGELFDPGQ